MAVQKVLFGITVLANLVLAGKHDIYSGYSVYGVQLRDASDAKILHELEMELNLYCWQYGVPGVRDALMMVSPENSDIFLEKMDANGLIHYLHASGVTKTLEEYDESIENWKQSRSNRMVPFQNYPRYAEIDAYMERIAAQYPNLVTIVNAGPSYEGRDIKYLKISTTNFTDTSKPIYFMSAMMHGAEWVTAPVALYSIHRLVEDLRDGDRDLLDNTDWIIMPLVNPDGYEYSHTTERLWRWTRSYNPVNETCYGVDPNRNFDYSWNTLGVTFDPCTIFYPGTQPFSEVETRYVRNIFQENEGRIQLYMDMHSFGNLVLFAYGDNSLPSNAAHIQHVGSIMGAAIDTLKLPQALYYAVGNSALLLYPTSGTSQDFAQKSGVPFSFTLELPSLGYMFSVPPEYIEQINQETWAGIAASARVSVLYYKHYKANRN